MVPGDYFLIPFFTFFCTQNWSRIQAGKQGVWRAFFVFSDLRYLFTLKHVWWLILVLFGLVTSDRTLGFFKAQLIIYNTEIFVLTLL